MNDPWIVRADGSRIHRETKEIQAAPEFAPVQGYARGIPWSMHLDAYDAYCKKYGRQIALIDWHGRGCRGGFGTSELDDFVPGWRDKVSEHARLQEQITELQAKLDAIPTTGSGSGDFMIGGKLWPGLSKLLEEAGEVIQVGGKLMGSAGRTDHWSGDLRKMFVEELGDLTAAIAFFIEQNDLPMREIAERQFEKHDLFRKWHAEGLAS